MDHIEVTTTLDVDTTCAVLGDVVIRRGFRIEWEDAWSATVRKGLRRIEVTVFTPRPGHTVVHVLPNALPWYYFGGLLAGVWLDVSTDRLATRIAEALTEQEHLSRGPAT